jgi:hypothetical protein
MQLLLPLYVSLFCTCAHTGGFLSTKSSENESMEGKTFVKVEDLSKVNELEALDHP